MFSQASFLQGGGAGAHPRALVCEQRCAPLDGSPTDSESTALHASGRARHSTCEHETSSALPIWEYETSSALPIWEYETSSALPIWEYGTSSALPVSDISIGNKKRSQPVQCPSMLPQAARRGAWCARRGAAQGRRRFCRARLGGGRLSGPPRRRAADHAGRERVARSVAPARLVACGELDPLQRECIEQLRTDWVPYNTPQGLE